MRDRIRALLVDDEPLARQRLRDMLSRHADVELVGECDSGDSAVRAVGELQPDLLLLDIQMPGCDGLEVVRRLGTGRVPAIIFVTAYDEYAVRAFDVMALDYLLKPFDRDRFDQAIDRARQRLSGADDNALPRQLESLLENRGKRYPDRLIVRDAGRIHFLSMDEIRWIEAQGNYVKIHTPGESPMLRRPLKDMERQLDPARFARIHRSIIVNLEAIREMSPESHGEYVVTLADGTRLVTGRAYREQMKAILGE